MIAAVGFRTWLLISNAVPFNGDEAVVALMARHINMGEMTWFFYGQSYMGSLDALLIALGFRIFGEHVWVIRMVQLLLYVGFLYTGWLLARRVLVDAHAANMTVLVMAIPPVMVTTYTLATLGGYGETLLFGNLILLFGYEIVYGNWRDNQTGWFFLGLIGGLAFWTLGLAGIYLLPVGIAGLLHLKQFRPGNIGLGLLAFVVGSLPWWMENIQNQWSALFFLLGESELKLPPLPFLDRVFGFLFLGLPTVFGFRKPWEGHLEAGWMILLGVILLISLVLFSIEVWRRKLNVLKPGAGKLFFWMITGFIVIFLGTQFSMDSTGRYFLPIYVLISIVFGGLLGWMEARFPRSGWVLLGVMLLFHTAGVLSAASQPEGLTTQFGPRTRFNNEADPELIAFLQDHQLYYGYSNYWVTYRLAFLSDEQLIYSPRLPYQEDLSFTENDIRYPQYDDAVSAQADFAYITTLHPELDALLEKRWADRGVTYRENQIGPYHIYYDFSAAIRPMELDIYYER